MELIKKIFLHPFKVLFHVIFDNTLNQFISLFSSIYPIQCCEGCWGGYTLRKLPELTQKDRETITPILFIRKLKQYKKLKWAHQTHLHLQILILRQE